MRQLLKHWLFWGMISITLITVMATASNADKKAVNVVLPDGETLNGLTFSPGPEVPNRWPAVLVAANAGGIKLVQYHTYCQRLADYGFAVLLVDASGYPEWLTPGGDTWRKMPYHIWAWINHLSVVVRLVAGSDWYLTNIDSSVDFLRSHPRVDPDKIAISGFSQSANVSLMYASGSDKIASLVWNNGGSPWIQPYEPSRLPPTAIFHGDSDGVYNVRHALELAEELRKAEIDVECHIYPKERHMFNVYYDLDRPSDFDRPAIESSFNQLVAFLSRTLKKVKLAVPVLAEDKISVEPTTP